MTLAVCLAFYGALVAVGTPGFLRRHPVERAPRLGVAVWVTTVASALLAWTAAIGIIVAEALMTVERADTTCDGCLLGTGAGRLSGNLLDLLTAVVAAAGIAVLAWFACRVGHAACRLRQAGRQHARAVRLVGYSAPRLGTDTVVLDTADRVAYCLSGGRRTIVVTAGVLRSLTRDQLAAVLAHERAHLAGRHHLLLASLAVLRRSLRWVPLVRAAEAEVGRLLEMCADDAAACRYGHTSLVTALVALSVGPLPELALGASGAATLSRARRLLAPPSPAEQATARRQLGTVLLVAGLAPVMVFGSMALSACSVILG